MKTNEKYTYFVHVKNRHAIHYYQRITVKKATVIQNFYMKLTLRFHDVILRNIFPQVFFHSGKAGKVVKLISFKRLAIKCRTVGARIMANFHRS